MKRLYRSRQNRVFAGICGGIGEYLNIDPVLIRVIAVIITIFGGSGLIAYIVGLILIPLEPESGQVEASAKTETLKKTVKEKASAVSAYPGGLPIEKHISIIGWLYIAFSSITMIAAVVLFLAIAGGGIISGDEMAIAITTTVASIIASILVLIAAPGIICGIGLLKLRPWSRIFALILGAVNLINIPFGTALGIYTIWILMKPESEEIFKNK